MSATAGLAVAAALAGGLLGHRIAGRRAKRRLQTLANLLAALREEDFSIRALGAKRGEPLGDALVEANLLADAMAVQRRQALEATALLRAVMEEIDVAVFAFDADDRVRLVNRAGERLLGATEEAITGRTAVECGLGDLLAGDMESVERSFPGGSGRFGVRRTTFRERGLPMRLLVVANLAALLREEERSAWRRLIRVLGHELGNSLGPIRSIAESLRARLSRGPGDDDLRADLEDGLSVVAERAGALTRFLEGYAALARLPLPKRSRTALAPCVRSVAAMETRLPVRVEPGPDVRVLADRDQIEQLLINLVRNAADAAADTGGGVRIGWGLSPGTVELRVEDDGPGLANPSNLFVPFFTTKPGGSGIGLVLARQIAEAHGGTVSLENRSDAAGCVARVRLPL